jgi:hypothetical protein
VQVFGEANRKVEDCELSSVYEGFDLGGLFLHTQSFLFPLEALLRGVSTDLALSQGEILWEFASADCGPFLSLQCSFVIPSQRSGSCLWRGMRMVNFWRFADAVALFPWSLNATFPTNKH